MIDQVRAAIRERMKLAQEASGLAWRSQDDGYVYAEGEGMILSTSPMGHSEKRDAVARHAAANSPSVIAKACKMDLELLDELERQLADDHSDETAMWILTLTARRYDVKVEG